MASGNAKLVQLNTNKKEIEEICAKAQKVLDEERNINVSNSLGIAAIAYEFLNAAAQWLAENKKPGTDISIDLMQIIEMGISYRDSEDGENEGNFTPFVSPGQHFKTVIKDNEMTEDEE